jgi:quinol monooxygenase YgiN
MGKRKDTAAWDREELQNISSADDLKVSPFREDGTTYGTPTWIWNVAVDGDLYVRAYNGQKSRWYQAAVKQGKGRIHAAGMVKDVVFEPVSGEVNERIDNAYRDKYKSSSYLTPMIGTKAKEATIRIMPIRILSFILLIGSLMLSSFNTTSAQGNQRVVRMAKIQVDSAQLNEYKSMLTEEIETSVRVEPGVLTLYAVYEKDHPTHVTIFEVYADEVAYEAHLKTAHFKKYKGGTQGMVKALELVNVSPIALESKQ